MKFSICGLALIGFANTSLIALKGEDSRDRGRLEKQRRSNGRAHASQHKGAFDQMFAGNLFGSIFGGNKQDAKGQETAEGGASKDEEAQGEKGKGEVKGGGEDQGQVQSLVTIEEIIVESGKKAEGKPESSSPSVEDMKAEALSRGNQAADTDEEVPSVSETEARGDNPQVVKSILNAIQKMEDSHSADGGDKEFA